MHWAMPLLAELMPESLLKDMPQVLCNPHLVFDDAVESLPVFNGAIGELLFKSPTPEARRINRQAFRALLARGFGYQVGDQTCAAC